MKREFVTLKVDNDVLDRIRKDYESFLCPNNGEYIEFFARIKPRAASRVRAEQEKAAARDAVIVGDAWAVDAACSGNPGPMEYRCVDLADGKEVFHFGPIYGTNNIGEFLAIVHALALQKQLGIRRTIYSDSRNAMAWARAGHCRTKLPLHAKSEQVLRLVERAEAWLAKNGISVPVLKWQTELWGEVPADFGRK